MFNVEIPVTMTSVTTFAGNGFGFSDENNALFKGPEGVAIDKDGNLIISDNYNHKIRKISSVGVVTTVAGNCAGYLDGDAINSNFNYPRGVAIDREGNIFVADCYNHRIRKISSVGVVTTVAGDGTAGYLDGNGINSKFWCPYGVAIDKAGNIIVTDEGNHRIRKISVNGVVTTIAGNGTSGDIDGDGINSSFHNPRGVTIAKDGNIFVTDPRNHRIRKVSTNGVVTTVAGNGAKGHQDGDAINATFYYPSGITIDKDGNIFVADSGNNLIRKLSSFGFVSTVAGSGTRGCSNGNGINSQFNYTAGVAIDKYGCTVFVTDYNNHRIRKIILEAEIIAKWPLTHSLLVHITKDINIQIFCILIILKNYNLPGELNLEIVKAFLWVDKYKVHVNIISDEISNEI